MELIYEKSRPGRRAGRSRRTACRCRRSPPSSGERRRRGCPEVPENEIVRHFTALADRNFGIDTGFYPLGSAR